MPDRTTSTADRASTRRGAGSRRRGAALAVKLASPRAVRDTRIVGACRVGSAASFGLALVVLGRVFEGAGGSTVLLGVVLAVVAGTFAFAELSYGGRAARAEERRLRARLLTRHLTTVPDSEESSDDAGPARLIQLMTDNVERVTEYRQVYLGATIAAIAIPFLTLAAVGVFIDPVVGFGVMAAVPVIPLGIGGFMRFFRGSAAGSRSERAHLAGRYVDAIRNLVVIRLLGAGQRVEDELRAQGERNRGAIMRLLAGNQIVIIVMDGLFGLGLICLTAALTVARAEHLSGAETLSIMLLTILLLEPLQQVAGFFYIGMGGIASQRALRTYLASNQIDAAEDDAPPAPGLGEPGWVPDPALAVEVRGVTYDYGRGPVLRGVDLVVPTGARVAIMGRSGAGKSTLMDLLSGQLAPQQGYVAVAGNAVTAADLAAARALSATVAQHTWMFTGTVADNLRIARGEATEAEMWHALEQAHVADEVARMPEGLYTYLGEGALLVSGGQAQRISLARALLSGRRVLLLDEPTSQVDLGSEARIVEAVAALPADRTVVIVTHRPSLLDLVDTSYELVDGRLEQMEPARG